MCRNTRFGVAVPSPFGVMVGIMAAAVVPERIGRPIGCKMPAERGSMGNKGSSAIAEEGKGTGINETKLQGREDG